MENSNETSQKVITNIQDQKSSIWQSSRVINRLRSYKLALIFWILIVICGILYLLGFVAELYPQIAGLLWLKSPTLVSLRGDLFSGAIIGLILALVVRNENEKLLISTISKIVARAMNSLEERLFNRLLLDESSLTKFAAPDRAKKLLNSAFSSIIGDRELSRDIQAILNQHALDPQQRIFNYFYTITLGRVSSESGLDTAKFVVARIRICFDGFIDRSSFVFRSTHSQQEFEDLLRDTGIFSVWLLPAICKESAEHKWYEIKDFRINGTPATIVSDSPLRTICSFESHYPASERFRIDYSFTTIIAKNEHSIFTTIDKPTKHLRIVFDLGDSDINPTSLYAIDYFTCSIPARIVYEPEVEAPRRITVEHDEWVFPKGGVVFVW